MKSVSRKNLMVFALILIGVSIFVIPCLVSQSKAKLETKKTGEVYYCPMHPSYVSDRPGDCPICSMKLVPKLASGNSKKEHKILYYRHPMGQPDISPTPKKDSMGMDYIPVYEDEISEASSNVPGHATVQIPVQKQQLMGVKLETAGMRKLTQEIRTVGRVVYDPELFTAQQEFISALDSVKKSGGTPYHELKERAGALVESTRTRLRLLGMSEQEIAELETKSVQDRNLILPVGTGPRARPGRPQGGAPTPQFVWIYATIYEYELPFVKIGTPLKVRVPTFPDKEFVGEVRALDPVLDMATRSIRIRARVGDPERLLRPEMYVDVYLETDLGETLSVPKEAVMLTGERAIVFVAQGQGTFQPREVKLGAKTEDFYEVKSGLGPGEQVVVTSNFLIDSESRLQGALEGMVGEHQHG